MILCFELSMPSTSSWNGRWSGKRCYYAKVVNFGRTKKAVERAQTILSEGYFRYSFGDGWVAGISVRQVDAKEAAKIRRKTDGFCRYEWMIESIKRNNCIRTD